QAVSAVPDPAPTAQVSMSQQFLSKYFKRPGDTNDDPAGSSKKPAAKEKVKRQASPHTGSPGDAASGGSRYRETSAAKRKKATSSSAGGDTRRSADWQCPKCTFNNPAAKRACEMCGGHQVVGGTAAREEIEISGSDSEADANSKSGGIGDDDGGSDFEDLPIGRNPKRPRTGAGAQGSNKPTSSSSLGKNKERPAGGKQERPLANKPPGQSKPPPAGGDTCVSLRKEGGAAALDGAMEEVQEIGGERGRARGGDSSSKGDPDDCSSSSNSSRLAVFGGGRGSGGSSAAVFSADSFNLEEDARRRKDFQAGLRAALPDDSDDGPSVAAAGSGGKNSSTGDNGAPGGGLGTATEAGGGATSTSSRGKGKAAAAAAGRVKLTPMEQQVVDLKAKHPGVLLLVECGYRYRFFGDDALAAAKVLRIYAHMDHNFQVASVPTFRLAVHLRRLVDAGYKARDQLRVGVVRQAESAALKAAGLTETGKKSGTFKRELAAVFSQASQSRATWVEGAVEALMPSSSGFNTGTGGSSGTDAGKSGGQGSFRKIGGAWRRVGGWGKKGGKGGGGGGGATEDSEQPGEPQPPSEADMDAPLPQLDHERSEQWLMSMYEEDASPGASTEGEPLSISIALNDGGGGVAEKQAERVRVGLIAVDVRTGKVVHDAFEEGSGQRQELHTRLRHLRPLELLLPGPRLSKETEATVERYCESAVDARGDRRVVRTERLPPEDFCFEAAQASLSKYYGKGRGASKPDASEGEKRGDSEGGGDGCAPVLTRVLDLPRPAICALGPLMTHLERFGLDRSLASPDLSSFSKSQYMTLDAVTLRDLEVLQCQADGREAGSLFSILDRTQTAFGRRVLAGWVRQPLLSPEDITARQDAVEELVTDPPSVMERLRPTLRDLKDLDPAIASLHHRRIQPNRLLSLLGTMRKVFGVFHPPTARGADETEGAGPSQQRGGPRSAVLLDALAGVPANMAPVIARYLGELNAEAAASDDYARALVDGESLCKELKTAAEEEESAKADLETELQSVRTILRKPSLQWKTLRTGATSTLEYLVELRKSEAKKVVPSGWMQVSQTKDLARFHTPEVLRLQQELLRARESRNLAARQAWAELVSQVDEECYAGFRTAVQALGTLDALLSLAVVAKLPGYVRPNYRPTADANGDEIGGDGGSDDDADGVDEIVLRGARHPTVERVLEGGFVPNDVSLRRGECLVVTGPNMGGKSSTVRMAALICIMGQMGSYVPADSADMYCLDGVYTRMGAGDDLAADMSTFMVELWHTSYIIKHATRRSLVILDELGRGTSTHDGVAIALATLRHVVRDIGCATLFVTHYPQVADLASDKSLR
ncbi:unnamed protein product, partial [Ectocarpus sp. 8 AP-2014]